MLLAALALINVLFLVQGRTGQVVALILAVSATLFRAAIVDVWTALILLTGLLALLRFKIDTFWLVSGGAAAGLAHYLLA